MSSAVLEALIEPAVTALGCEFVGCQLRQQDGRTVLCVYIDKEPGVTVDDCESISHQVSGVLAVNDPIRGHYVLEVSSPGLERPLFTLKHFQQFVGNRIKLKLKSAVGNQKNYTGILNNVEGDEILLQVNDHVVKILFSNIERANLAPVF